MRGRCGPPTGGDLLLPAYLGDKVGRVSATELPDKQEPQTQVSFRMPLELHRRLKIALIHDGRTMQEVLNGMIEAWVRKKEERNE